MLTPESGTGSSCPAADGRLRGDENLFPSQVLDSVTYSGNVMTPYYHYFCGAVSLAARAIFA